MGTLNRTMSHMECELWSNHPDSRFVFPDGSAEKAGSFCRYGNRQYGMRTFRPRKTRPTFVQRMLFNGLLQAILMK